MTALSQSAFARHLGVERSYVTQLKKAGRLVMTDDGQVDVEASEARIAETADPGKAGVVERHAKQRGEAPARPATDEEPEDEEVASRPDYQRSRARREEANAKLAEIEVEKEAGGLYVAALADAVVADAVTVFRTTLESRRPLLVSQMATMTDEADLRLFLEEQDEALLGDLHQRFAALADEARASS